MSFGHALYYPHINLTNKNWIKHALLFWDKISRIVPQAVEPSDDEDIIRIKCDTGFIEDYHPEEGDTSRTFQDFSEAFKNIMESDLFYNDRDFKREGHVANYNKNVCGNRRRYSSELARASGTYILKLIENSKLITPLFMIDC